VPDDPIAALYGIFADLRRPGLTAAEAVRQARDEDVEISESKWPTPET
jgi:hypothetical protein